MVSDTYKKIGTSYLTLAVASLVTWATAKGHLPTDLAPLLQSSLVQWGMGAGVVIVATVQQVRGALREEAKRLLPSTANPIDVEMKMAELGWSHVLWAAKGGTDPKYDELRSEVLLLKSGLADLKARVDAATGGPIVTGGPATP